MRRFLEEESADSAWALAAQLDLQPLAVENNILVLQALNLELAQSRSRMLYLLSALAHTQTLLDAKINLESRSGDRQAIALEMLDTLIDPDLKPMVFPFLDDITPQQRLARVHARFSQKRMPPHERMFHLITRSPTQSLAWTRACSVYGADRDRETTLLTAVRAATADSDPLVRETGSWALSRLETEEEKSEADPVMLTLEKILILKSVDIFSEVKEPGSYWRAGHSRPRTQAGDGDGRNRDVAVSPGRGSSA